MFVPGRMYLLSFLTRLQRKLKRGSLSSPGVMGGGGAFTKRTGIAPPGWDAGLGLGHTLSQG